MEIMDFPSNFSFLEKLKLYQNYLKNGSRIEKTKNRYWLYGKALLYWYYSEDNMHVGKPISASCLLSNEDIIPHIRTVARRIVRNDEEWKWLEVNATNRIELMHVIGNLYVMGFIKEVSRYNESDIKKELVSEEFLHAPKEFFVSGRGFLLGELLYDLSNPHFIERHFFHFQLHWATRPFYLLLIVVIITAVLVFLYNLEITGILPYLQHVSQGKGV